MNWQELFDQRNHESKLRLESVRNDLNLSIQAVEDNLDSPDICIYATGSLARLEATIHSDLDAFFFCTGSKTATPLSRIRDIQILNNVIDIADRNNFPDFSNEGEYLKFLHLDDMLNHIGGREDDYHNAFTARMLLILESTYLYNETLFENIRRATIERYFQDFHTHSSNFRPLFLLNDVLRFWRTLCLNYEHGRRWRVENNEKRAKGHLANLKLRFSRLNICFSFISSLLSRGQGLTPEVVLEVANLSPIDRLNELSKDRNLSSFVEILLEEYGWFLESVGKDKSAVLEWISNEENRTSAFKHSDRFTNAMFNMVHSVAEPQGYLRYLVI